MVDFDILTADGVAGLRRAMRNLRDGYSHIWYAVTYGDYPFWDNGSANLTEAIREARAMLKDTDYDGSRIDILCIDNHNEIDPFCLGGFTLRDAAADDAAEDNEVSLGFDWD